MNDTALYSRLSRDDGIEDCISQSIINQQSLLQDFADKNKFSVYDIYSDDGYSGTDFNRPDFKRMISDIRNGFVKNVIVKDLSRLGRDYVMTGFYIERFFPENNVRFIAVNDNMDTNYSESLELSPFKAVMNDMYARDISKKVRVSLDTLKRQGKFIGSSAPYGYQKDMGNKNHLIEDKNVSDIVRLIFDMFIDGKSYTQITDYLNNNDIKSPLQYKKDLSVGKWNSTTVKNILINETYAGNLTQNKRKKVNCKINKRVAILKEQWITVKNTHQPIVSYDIFCQVQQIIKDRRGGL